MDNLLEKKLMSLIDNLVDEKLAINEKILKFSFYEVRVKNGITSEQEGEFLRLATTKLNNMKYRVYLSDEEFTFDGDIMKVQPNELLIAVKE